MDVLNCETLKQVRKDFMSGKYPCNVIDVKWKKNPLQERDEWETLRLLQMVHPCNGI